MILKERKIVNLILFHSATFIGMNYNQPLYTITNFLFRFQSAALPAVVRLKLPLGLV